MEISDLIRVILRRKWIVVVTALAALVATYGYSSMQPKLYRATAIVRVLTAVVGDSNWVDYNIMYTDRLINTYTTLLGTVPVTTEIMARLDFDTLPDIAIEPMPNTELLQINASDEDPEHAADAANAVADIFVTQDVNVFNTDLSGAETTLQEQRSTEQASLEALEVQLATLQAAPALDTTAINDINLQIETVQRQLDEIDQELAGLQLLSDSRQGEVVLVEQAAIPINPEANGTPLFLILGLMGGVVAGVGLALGLHLLDQRLYTVQEIESVIRQPIIARIPQIATDIPDLFGSSTPNPEREALRRLCILLQQQLSLHEIEDGPGIIILVTGYPDGNDKALIATGLAYGMAETGIKTLLVEGDLVKPSIVAPQSTSRDEDAAAEDETLSSLSVRWRSPYIDLSIIPSMASISDDQHLPQFYLRLQKEIELARRSYCLVIISAPSPLASVHSARLVSLADVTLVVTQRGISRQPLLELVAELQRFESTKLEFIESNASIADRIKEYRDYWSVKDSGDKARRRINAFWSQRDAHSITETSRETNSSDDQFTGIPVEAVASLTQQREVLPVVTHVPGMPLDDATVHDSALISETPAATLSVAVETAPVDLPAEEAIGQPVAEMQDNEVRPEVTQTAAASTQQTADEVEPDATITVLSRKNGKAQPAAQPSTQSSASTKAELAEPIPTYELPMLDITPDEIPTSEVMVADIAEELDDPSTPGTTSKTDGLAVTDPDETLASRPTNGVLKANGQQKANGSEKAVSRRNSRKASKKIINEN